MTPVTCGTVRSWQVDLTSEITTLWSSGCLVAPHEKQPTMGRGTDLPDQGTWWLGGGAARLQKRLRKVLHSRGPPFRDLVPFNFSFPPLGQSTTKTVWSRKPVQNIVPPSYFFQRYLFFFSPNIHHLVSSCWSPVRLVTVDHCADCGFLILQLINPPRYRLFVRYVEIDTLSSVNRRVPPSHSHSLKNTSAKSLHDILHFWCSRPFSILTFLFSFNFVLLLGGGWGFEYHFHRSLCPWYYPQTQAHKKGRRKKKKKRNWYSGDDTFPVLPTALLHWTPSVDEDEFPILCYLYLTQNPGWFHDIGVLDHLQVPIHQSSSTGEPDVLYPVTYPPPLLLQGTF